MFERNDLAHFDHRFHTSPCEQYVLEITEITSLHPMKSLALMWKTVTCFDAYLFAQC